MSDALLPAEEPAEHRVEERSQLSPEEQAAGSDDPLLQARIILEDSDARTEQPGLSKELSDQTPD